VRARRQELRAALIDTGSDPRVRVAALGALVRGGTPTDGRWAWAVAAADDDPGVRRRAAELTARVTAAPAAPLLTLLVDDDPLVREAACWAAGEVEWSDAYRTPVVAAVVADAAHRDPLVREAAVAALGALGDESGLPVVLAACEDKPAVRRRAVLALAAFTGPDVEAALVRARDDPDWQTRQSAEDLTGPAS
jgi:HEAT repeat protein